ncbi:hypothetical protein Q0M94_19410 (plasmid) [Deinococcus radiomollis]|uniref:hypothetical protein n=1 Tax=Deinococcus radiomollis TaxID=468916 RepID=UPI003892427A
MDEHAIDQELLESALATHRQPYPGLQGPVTSGTRALKRLMRSPSGRLQEERPEADAPGGER